MSREIKFRVWGKKNEYMLYQEIIDVIDLYNEEIIIRIETEDGIRPDSKSFDDLVFMQYTGLKDKNGIEIYEGDICKVSAEEPYSNDYFITEYDWEMIMAIDFSYGALQFREINDKHMSIYYIETQDMDIEVIGNIYEDKSLLKRTKDE